ncbi:hypothetical protein GLU64_01885 [Nanohaloarchaea archaeon]|nr:hypothetical protein [Candidatus Nanohaloarchaea archaeon]
MALINGLEGRRSVQSKLVLFTALFTILSAFSTGATVKSGDFNLDSSEFDFSENTEIAVWSEETPKTTENVSPGQPLNPGEELPLGVTVDADTDSIPQFGEELELYSTQDGTDYQRITDYGFLNRHLKLENGELSFVVPSVEIEGSKGLNTEDAIQVEGRVHGEDFKQASDKIDVSDYLNGKTGGINLRKVREGEDKSYTVKVDKASPQVKNIAKINSTAVRIQIEDPGAAKIDNKSFLNDNIKLQDDVFSYEPITSELGTDAPGHKFRYLKDESSADEAAYLLLLDEKFEESKALEIFLDSPISDTQGNEITNLGLEGRVNDMNDQPPQVVTELVGDQQLTIGGNFKVEMYARSVDDVESVSIDASEVSENGVKGKSQGLQKQNTCGNDDWESECVKFEKEFTVTRGSDGLNTIQVSASNENGKTSEDKQVDLSIVPQDAQKITVYDKENGKHDGDIDTADVKFESEIEESSVDKNGWKLIGPESETEAVSAELKEESSKVVELTFESDVDTTDANKVDVVYNSPQNDFLKTSNGARVPSINKGTIVETDEAAPVPVDYRLQESYDKAVLKFSEKITSATYEKAEYYEANVKAIEDSKMAIVNIDVGIGSPDEFEEEFSAEDGTDSESVTKAISRSEAGEDSRFVVLNKGWNIAALPVPGDVEGAATTDKSLSEGEELSSLSCVEQTYRRVGSWSTGVSDLSHKYGTYVESNRPCILEFSTEDSDSPVSIGKIDSSEVDQGWNLLSPYTGSDGFNWIDDEFSEDVDEDQIFAPEDAIEEDVSLSDDEDDLNRYDSYWVENEN